MAYIQRTAVGRIAYPLVAFIATTITSIAVQGQTDPALALRNARSLKCHFTAGTAVRWNGSKPRTMQADNNQEVVFDSIDLKTQTARVIGNLGANDLRVIGTPVGITFFEWTPGLVDTTTVFAKFGDATEFVAVDSRHALFMDTLLTEQYPGTCRIWR